MKEKIKEEICRLDYLKYVKRGSETLVIFDYFVVGCSTQHYKTNILNPDKKIISALSKIGGFEINPENTTDLQFLASENNAYTFFALIKGKELIAFAPTFASKEKVKWIPLSSEFEIPKYVSKNTYLVFLNYKGVMLKQMQLSLKVDAFTLFLRENFDSFSRLNKDNKLIIFILEAFENYHVERNFLESKNYVFSDLIETKGNYLILSGKRFKKETLEKVFEVYDTGNNTCKLGSKHLYSYLTF